MFACWVFSIHVDACSNRMQCRALALCCICSMLVLHCMVQTRPAWHHYINSSQSEDKHKLCVCFCRASDVRPTSGAVIEDADPAELIQIEYSCYPDNSQADDDAQCKEQTPAAATGKTDDTVTHISKPTASDAVQLRSAKHPQKQLACLSGRISKPPKPFEAGPATGYCR